MWPFGSRTTRKPRPWTRMLRARYDAAITNAENLRHWANADGLSADASASPEVRQVLRNRSRYEVANNSYAKGIVMTLANDCIGTGPRLQLLSEDTEANSLIEAAFMAWASAIRLPAKLRIMRMAKAVDGEVFGMLIVNPMLPGPIKLDLQVVEADRVTQPDVLAWSDDTVDGIEYDRFGNPVSYYVLRHHPGQVQFPASGPAYERVNARVMLHWLQADRPGQHRGVPEITPALPLFAQLPSSRWISSNLRSAWPPCCPMDGSWGRSRPSSLARPMASSSVNCSTRSPAA
jgi:capsid protein